MAGSRSLLALLGVLAVGLPAEPVVAQPPSTPERPARPEKEGRPDHPEPRRHFFPNRGPEGDAMRERAMRELQKLSPEQRADLWRAVWAVLNLPPEKRQMLLGVDDERRKKAREEMQRSIDENGLQLDDERKKAFFHRYFEERRSIEERIRKESDEKRRQMMREMWERLTAEFGAPPGPPANPSDDAK